MTDCPQCHRRLLSHASAKCNWCGCEIADPAYQQQAATEREAFFVQEAIHDAASLARIESIRVGDPFLAPLDPFLDPFTGLPLGTGLGGPRGRRPVLPPVPPMPQSAPTAPPSFGHAYGAPEPSDAPEAASEEAPGEADTGGRFDHLEL